MGSQIVLESFDVAEIEEVSGIDLLQTTAPTMGSLEDAQTLIDTLWALSRALLKTGLGVQGLHKQNESLQTLLSSADEAHVHQGIQLMQALDDPEVWQTFAAGISVTPTLEIGGLIKGWVQPQYQLHVALLVGQCAGLFAGSTSIDVSAYVSGLGNLPFQGVLGQSIWPTLQKTPLTLHLRENTYPANRAKDIEPIAALTNLTALSLTNWQALRNLGPLENLTRLTTLSLQRCPHVRNLSPLKGLTSLTSIHHLSARNLSNLRPLQGLTNLTSLHLNLSESARDLRPLKALTNLTSLTLYGASSIRDLSPLKGLTNLTSLTLYNTRTQDLSPLKGMTRLKSLTLGSNASVPEAEVQGLQSSLPGCTINR